MRGENQQTNKKQRRDKNGGLRKRRRSNEEEKLGRRGGRRGGNGGEKKRKEAWGPVNAGLVIEFERSRVRVPAGASGKFSSPGSTFFAGLFRYPSHPMLPQQRKKKKRKRRRKNNADKKKEEKREEEEGRCGDGKWKKTVWASTEVTESCKPK